MYIGKAKTDVKLEIVSEIYYRLKSSSDGKVEINAFKTLRFNYS